ncbi:hypothetical protein QEV83_10750 [Methylocapsa sp. D3K7]|uniref:hypothetical protein n=1 Tax=Methylocapsa sp. D3K7 TaxID=3041435 RepID=UPI00244EFD71|nr:hypothetical protein [Methylocapsa sp. D3K7]WGJ13196.1 hypothetical protein QEV83_10750 [Methylocapsa sp. D3K7]
MRDALGVLAATCETLQHFDNFIPVLRDMPLADLAGGCSDSDIPSYELLWIVRE